MKTRKINFLVIVLITMLLFSCSSDDENIDNTPQKFFTANVQNWSADKDYYIVLNNTNGEVIEFKEITANGVCEFEAPASQIPEKFSVTNFIKLEKRGAYFFLIETVNNIAKNSSLNFIDKVVPSNPTTTVNLDLTITNISKEVNKIRVINADDYYYFARRGTRMYDHNIDIVSGIDIFVVIEYEDGTNKYINIGKKTANSVVVLNESSFKTMIKTTFNIPTGFEESISQLKLRDTQGRYITSIWGDTNTNFYHYGKMNGYLYDFDYRFDLIGSRLGHDGYFEYRNIVVDENPVVPNFSPVNPNLNYINSSLKDLDFTINLNFDYYLSNWLIIDANYGASWAILSNDIATTPVLPEAILQKYPILDITKFGHANTDFTTSTITYKEMIDFVTEQRELPIKKREEVYNYMF